MKFLTCRGALSGKKVTTIFPNFVSMIARAVWYFFTSSGVGGVGACAVWAAAVMIPPVKTVRQLRATRILSVRVIGFLLSGEGHDRFAPPAGQPGIRREIPWRS